jgi:hypothetical protein
MLSCELEDRAVQNGRDERKTPTFATSATLGLTVESSRPMDYPPLRKEQAELKGSLKGRPFQVSLHNSPDTIAYERTLHAIYDSYGSDRESRVNSRSSRHGESFAELRLSTTLFTSMPAESYSSPLPVKMDSKLSSTALSTLGTGELPGERNGIKLSTGPPLLSSNTLHSTLSRQSFASDTDLLSQHNDRCTSTLHASQTAHPDTHLSDESSQPSHLQDSKLIPDTGRLQLRTSLHRQGTDDFVTSIVTYEPDHSQDSSVRPHVRSNSIDSGSKESHDKEVESGNGGADGGYGLSGSVGRGQLTTLRKARGWRRVSDLGFHSSRYAHLIV